MVSWKWMSADKGSFSTGWDLPVSDWIVGFQDNGTRISTGSGFAGGFSGVGSVSFKGWIGWFSGMWINGFHRIGRELISWFHFRGCGRLADFWRLSVDIGSACLLVQRCKTSPRAGTFFDYPPLPFDFRTNQPVKPPVRSYPSGRTRRVAPDGYDLTGGGKGNSMQ